MTRNTMLFSAAVLAAITTFQVAHTRAAADGIRLAQAEPPPPPPGERRPPGQPPPRPGTPGTPGQQHPPGTNAPAARPGATAQPGQPARPGTPPANTAQTPPGQQPPHPGTPPANTAQTPPGQQPVRPGTPPANTAQTPPGQQPLRPGTPPANTAQTPPGQQPLRPGTPPANTAQTPPGQLQRPVPPAAQQNAVPPGGQRPGTPTPAALAPVQPPRPGVAAPVVANAPVDPRAMPQHLDQLRGERHEVQEGGRTVIQEADRTIVREGGHDIIRHDEAARFRFNARDVNVEHRGNLTVVVALRPDGSRIITETDETGRLIRRLRRDPEGREVIIIDNGFEPRGPGFAGYFVNLPPPVIRIPRELYIRDLARASAEDVYLTLMAPPVERIDRRYGLDEIRYSEPLRLLMPRIDIDTVNFATASWEIAPDQLNRLAFVAQAITRALQRNPREVFLIEGHTDAVGNDIDNLSLSDRRAESVAVVLTNQFGIPPENLTTQGYGKQFLKIPTEAPELANRRVAVRRITPLLMGQN